MCHEAHNICLKTREMKEVGKGSYFCPSCGWELISNKLSLSRMSKRIYFSWTKAMNKLKESVLIFVEVIKFEKTCDII